MAATVLERIKVAGKLGLGAPLVILLMMMMMVLPLPPFILDLLFTFNIAFSLLILLVTIYTLRPLDFAVFPSVLLVATLLRLSLNVASTRVVLLEGHKGPDAAGKVIEAFGEFVIGGNYAVGLVVFIILVIINFVVVTKGAGRVSEVSARFTLDAMPGKQMAIDADLNAGLINQDEARTRRQEVSREADFYGSMDGASKFVRGDAIAGILILLINVVGGLIVGMLQHDLAFSEALHNYTLLTIGDGLVAQIPSLLLSVGSAMIVTRVSSSNENIGAQFSAQFFADPRPLALSAGVVGLLGLIPGMPNLAFLLLAGAMGASSYSISKRQRRERELAEARVAARPSAAAPEVKELGWDDVVPVDLIGLEVGYRLIPLVDKNQGGQLMSKIKGVRKKLSQDLGFLIPSVHIRDNLDLTPNAYRISLLGVTVGEAEVFPDRLMAINPGRVYGTLKGVEGKDPAFGLEAVWIEPDQRDHAQTLGYTVVDPGTVVVTHLSHLLQSHAHQLLGHQETQQLLDLLAKSMPRLVEDLTPKTLPLSVIVKVLQNLLQENVPIRDMRTIAETLAEFGGRSQDPGVLTAVVRAALGRLIVQKISGMEKEIPVLTLDPDLEQLLQKILQTAGHEGAGIEPGLAEQLHKSLDEKTQKLEMEGHPAILLVSSPVRPWLARFVRHSIPGLNVLAYNEIPEDRQVRVVASIGQRG
ncbi:MULTISPECIES: flagellar biosynthesis protein FlhA [Methylocaldum]|jgi:flagellar biosynthesis protein FlhA|uniref:flagellar biosynthesis protein FlhA n=1 Tax=unclassified Methylocaldum TaxID=2622260 RepID=UPI000A320929|nr:flagellar biosynthesis protein FlhA [Methylocaldum sp. RMAD-M]MBP1149596.1 flagellar biosynthesis protein FlhA [Methylocaldum sp. RMAD-M]